MSLVLASTSPRRKELLSLLQVRFESVAPSFAEEPGGGLSAAQQVVFFAQGKARSCTNAFPDSIVLGSDTLVVVNGHPLGKPANREDALSMLKRLRGREHVVHTGVALVR